MIKVLLTITAFTLIFVVSASAQDGTRRGDQRFMAEQQRRDFYEPQRRRERLRDERRDNMMLGDQPWWRTENWWSTRAAFFSCADNRHASRFTRAVGGAGAPAHCGAPGNMGF